MAPSETRSVAAWAGESAARQDARVGTNGSVDAFHLRTLVTGKAQGKPSDDELRRGIAADLLPDQLSADTAIGATWLDDRYFNGSRRLGRRLLRRLPLIPAQMVTVLLLSGRYDAVVTWGERQSVLVAALSRLRLRRPAHVAILVWPSKRNKTLLRLALRGIDRFLVPAPLQERYVEQELRVPAKRLVHARWSVDTRFWRPMGAKSDVICAVGQEMRDYGTLLEAVRPLDIPCHIAAGTGPFDPFFDPKANGNERVRFLESDPAADDPGTALPPNVTLGRKPHLELRELYARARFVVIPLVPSDTDNGITVALEAFAMGKAVICTESPGQVGLLEDGVNCVRVPPFDPDALREAIVELWSDPAKCARLGAAGRLAVEQRHSFELWGSALVQAVTEAVATRKR